MNCAPQGLAAIYCRLAEQTHKIVPRGFSRPRTCKNRSDCASRLQETPNRRRNQSQSHALLDSPPTRQKSPLVLQRQVSEQSANTTNRIPLLDLRYTLSPNEPTDLYSSPTAKNSKSASLKNSHSKVDRSFYRSTAKKDGISVYHKILAGIRFTKRSIDKSSTDRTNRKLASHEPAEQNQPRMSTAGLMGSEHLRQSLSIPIHAQRQVQEARATPSSKQSPVRGDSSEKKSHHLIEISEGRESREGWEDRRRQYIYSRRANHTYESIHRDRSTKRTFLRK